MSCAPNFSEAGMAVPGSCRVQKVHNIFLNLIEQLFGSSISEYSYMNEYTSQAQLANRWNG